MPLTSIFNPSNDMALAANVREYVPPKRIQQMEADLAPLAQLWEGTHFAGPWGWSMATKRRYERMGTAANELPSDEWLAEVRRLSSREFASQYIKDLLQAMDDKRLLGESMTFVSNTSAHAEPTSSPSHPLPQPFPIILKSPWSSSGRGIFVSRAFDTQTQARLQGFMTSQGGYLADRFYANKDLDFAMEFFINADHSVDFLGYSVFHADTTGTYGFNLVESQEELLRRIDVDPSLLQKLVDYHTAHLSRIAYHGAVGIDMLRCTDGRIHPCVEINFRMNMGILAMLLHQRLGSGCSAALTPARPHGFQAIVDKGKLMINFKK